MSNGFLVRTLRPTSILAVTSPAAPSSFDDLLIDMIGVQYISGNTASTDLIDLDFGSAVTLDTIALLQTNGSATGLLVRGGADRASLDTAPDLFLGTFAAGTVTPLSGRTHALALLSAPASHRWWRVGFTGLSAPIQIGRLVTGLRWTPEVNFSFGAQIGARDLAGGEFSRRGVWLPSEGAIQRSISLRWPFATKQEAEEQVSVLLESFGNRGHVLLVTDPDVHPQRQRRMYFGPLQGNLGAVWNVGQRFEWRADVASVI